MEWRATQCITAPDTRIQYTYEYKAIYDGGDGGDSGDRSVGGNGDDGTTAAAEAAKAATEAATVAAAVARAAARAIAGEGGWIFRGGRSTTPSPHAQ